MQAYLKEISEALQRDIVPVISEYFLSVFVVGAARQEKGSLRNSVRSQLSYTRKMHYIEAFYPEEIFEGLVVNKRQFDLLSLENMLARSVNVVLILLESPGAIAELGAFANHKELRDRIVLVVDNNYKKSNSFIRRGPVQYLISRTGSAVIFHSFNEPNDDKFINRLKRKLFQVGIKVKPKETIENIFICKYFTLAAIYVMEPIDKKTLVEMVIHLGVTDEKTAKAVITASINILISSRRIEFRNQHYSITSMGQLQLERAVSPRWNKLQHRNDLDSIRVKALNATLRRHKRDQYTSVGRKPGRRFAVRL